jgi:hypothetical protein
MRFLSRDAVLFSSFFNDSKAHVRKFTAIISPAALPYKRVVRDIETLGDISARRTPISSDSVGIRSNRVELLETIGETVARGTGRFLRQEGEAGENG